MSFSKIAAFILILVPMAFFPSCTKSRRGPLKHIGYVGSYNRDFDDKNELHLQAAKENGIAPLNSRADAEKMKSRLKEMKTDKNYEIGKLRNSIPFLVPMAADLLSEIGKNFRDSLYRLNAPNYKIIVTSMMRTKDDVRKLRTHNENSSENSSHFYGTTFDVSWKRFVKEDRSDTLEIDKDDLKKVLASVLRDLKRRNLCYVKHERKQACFHITAR